MAPGFFCVGMICFQDTFNIRQLVVEFAFDLAVGEYPAISPGLQGSFADVQRLHYVLPVNPSFVKSLETGFPIYFKVSLDVFYLIRELEQ
jgi:hypothetical protein